MGALNDFSAVIVGSGTLTEYGTTGIRAEATGTDSARFTRDLPAIPGVKYTCSFTARIKTQGAGAALFAAIDYPASGTLADKLTLSDEFESYLFSFECPVDADPLVDLVSFSFGLFQSTAGTVEFSDIKLTSNEHQLGYFKRYYQVPIYNSVGTLISGGTISANISRVGDVVTLTSSLDFTSAVTESSVYSADDFLPDWAIPKRKSTQFCEFSTGGSYFTAVDVLSNTSKQKRVALYKRGIATTIVTDDFDSTNQVFSISYIAKSLYN
tara:strand:- start:29708 stop:30511 length:804 start_codon:yes stop_codon:yes gene_type:complete